MVNENAANAANLKITQSERVDGICAVKRE